MKKRLYDSETGEVYSAGEEEKEPREPMINEAYICSFLDSYEPCPSDDPEPDEVFAPIDLRTFFQAYTTDDARCVDLLPYYLKRLSEHGFRFTVDSCGEQQMKVNSKQ